MHPSGPRCAGAGAASSPVLGGHPLPGGVENAVTAPTPRPDDARFVVSDGASAPLVTDGPYPASKELLDGYRIVEVDTPERAVAAGAAISAAPGRGGAPVRQGIEVRQVMGAPAPRCERTSRPRRRRRPAVVGPRLLGR